MTRDEAVKLVSEYGQYCRMYGFAASPNERQSHHKNADAAREALIAALTAPAAGEDVDRVIAALEMARGHIQADLEHDYYFVREEARKQGQQITEAIEIVSRLRAVPQGWKLVPEVPGEWLLRDSVLGHDNKADPRKRMFGLYAAMLAAAPAAPAPEKGVG